MNWFKFLAHKGSKLRQLSKEDRIVLIQAFLFLCGALSIFTTLGIVFVLGQESALFFTNPEVNVVEFFTTFRWQPEIEQFGVWPLVNATLMTSLIAMLVSMPLGLGAAIYLSEYATPRVPSASGDGVVTVGGSRTVTCVALLVTGPDGPVTTTE